MTVPAHVTANSVLDALAPDKPVLVAGQTAVGKSALAMRIAEAQGGQIINADASQVYDCWRLLTARPGAEDEARVPHKLYGHVAQDVTYSVGDWLREVSQYLDATPRPIIVGGTGLYFTALTQGLADIPPIPPDIRADADELTRAEMCDVLDRETLAQIDRMNRARVQRAWEVLRATGRGLAAWQAETPAPLLPLTSAQAILCDAPKDWLTPRIARRFDLMLDAGALEEARAVLPNYDPNRPAHRAIGAPELIGYLRGETTLDEARTRAVIATRQFAKRQRTWFRSKMRHWPVYQNVT